MNRQRVALQLLQDEGLRLKPYRCTAGRLTIGVGRNLDDRGISETEAFMLLDNDIGDCWTRLSANLPWVADAPENVQEVLVNMAFNLGMDGLLQFTTALGHLQACRYAEAAQAMLASKWTRQVGKRAERLAEMVRKEGS
jgi:lysozyme